MIKNTQSTSIQCVCVCERERESVCVCSARGESSCSLKRLNGQQCVRHLLCIRSKLLPLQRCKPLQHTRTINHYHHPYSYKPFCCEDVIWIGFLDALCLLEHSVHGHGRSRVVVGGLVRVFWGIIEHIWLSGAGCWSVMRWQEGHVQALALHVPLRSLQPWWQTAVGEL